MKKKQTKQARNVDKLLPHAFSDHARRWTIGMLKEARRLTKNIRRERHGLPPIANYADI